MKIEVSDPGFYFAFFYVLSFTLTSILVIIYSIRQKLPLQSVLLMLTSVTLMTIIGSRLFTIPVNEWHFINSTGNSDNFHGRSAIGGLIFGLAGFIISQKFLGLGPSMFNLYAWTAPVGFGIQKLGCFFNGCCFGTQSDLPWSVQYPKETGAHFHHWVTGLINEDASYSLNVHPVQIYEVLGYFAIAYIIWRTQKIWKKSYSSLLFGLFLFFIMRFFSEFLRDPSSSAFGGTAFLGIKVLQWGLLIFGFVCGIILLIVEKLLKPIIQNQLVFEPSANKTTTYIILISVIIYFFRSLFSPYELFSLYLKFIPAIIYTGYLISQSLTTRRVRLASASFLFLPLLLISQTLSQDSAKTAKSVKNFYQDDVSSYKRIDFGTSFGSYYNTLRYNPQQGECGTTYTNEDYKYTYRVGEAGYSSVTKKGKSITTKGINLYVGIIRENNLTKQLERTNALIGVNPFIRFDLRWLGMGAGAHVGNILWVPANPIDEQVFNKGTRFSPVMPEVYFRVGRRDIVDLKYSYGFNVPTSLPVLLQEFSIGSGFGYKTDFGLRLGRSVSYSDTYTFISAEGLLNKQFGLNFRYDFGGGEYYNPALSTIEKGKGRILFGANYRFGFKK